MTQLSCIGFILAQKTVVTYLLRAVRRYFDLWEPAIEHNFLVNFRSFGTRNRCYAYALKPVKAPALWGIMLTISMSIMSSIIIGTQNCNSMDTVAEILHKVEIWSFTTILSVSTAYHTCQVVQDFSHQQQSLPCHGCYPATPLLLHLDLADPPLQLATWE